MLVHFMRQSSMRGKEFGRIMTVPNLMINLHIRIAASLHQSFLWLHPIYAGIVQKYPISSSWLHLKSVSEALIEAAQDQALYTNWPGHHILRTSGYFRFVLTVLPVH